MSELTATADNAEADTPVEIIHLKCPEVFCYKVPPQASAAGHRAEDWNSVSYTHLTLPTKA